MNGLNLWYQRCFFPKQSNSIILAEKKNPSCWKTKWIMTVIKWSRLSWTRRRNVRFLYLTRSAGFEGLGRTPLLKFPLSVSLRLPSPSPPSRDITSIQKYSYHEEVCCWKKWATFDQRASSQMYSSTRSSHSQTDFCIPEFHDKPLILRYSKAEEVLTVK